MADLLVAHLKMKAEQHSALRSLYSQWDFDEKLIPKALQTIGSLFPHYSRHDESHSKQILINIERLLGDNIAKLTATDTWLLLEAAYWHDIGMVVPSSDLEDAMNDPMFEAYVDSICAQTHHELYSFACEFKQNPSPALMFGNKSPVEMVSGFREFMAEWFRRKHPARAEQIVRTPMSSIGLNSPRTELIPARLFKLLGRICQMHGAPFENLIADGGLPFREAGLAQDDCHPRYIACLLRMGDLLDLDDNRFCPVMQRIAGDNRSSLSKAHEDKHSGIRHLRIDQERIEIVSECDTIDGYIEAFNWFDWLKQEVQDQMGHWRDIAPSRELGLLPMLGPISVRLSGNLQLIKEGERPAFTVDAEKAIELLQGGNLYDSRFACVRELLQNAVDATLLRVWLTKNKSFDAGVWETPGATDIMKILGENAVMVELTESDTPAIDMKSKSLWTLKISDAGTGISKSDLAYMLSIGGSQRNLEKSQKVTNMPDWMRPSGAFGIGLQSAFMLSNEILIETKSVITNEAFDIKMYSPTGAEKGLVVLRKLDNDVSVSYGTTVSLTFELDKYTKSWSVSFRDEESIARQVLSSLDPILDERFPYEAASLADQVGAFGLNSLIPVRGVLTTLSGRHEIRSLSLEAGDKIDAIRWRFVKTDAGFVRFRYQPMIGARFTQMASTYYRGQGFEAKGLYLPNVTFDLDLMSGKAGSWLNYNRDKVSSSASGKLLDTILQALQQSAEEDLMHMGRCDFLMGDDGEVRANFAFMLKSMACVYGGRWNEISKKLGDEWLDISISERGTIRHFFEQESWTVASSRSQELPAESCDLELKDANSGLTLEIILNEWLSVSNRTVKIEGDSKIFGPSPPEDQDEVTGVRTRRIRGSEEWFHPICRLAVGPQELFDKAALAAQFVDAFKYSHTNRRYYIPGESLFPELILSPEEDLEAYSIFGMLQNSDSRVLIPLLFVADNGNGISVQATAQQLEGLSVWTSSRLRTPKSIEEVRNAYSKLVNYIDQEIMKPTVYWERWRRARGLQST